MILKSEAAANEAMNDYANASSIWNQKPIVRTYKKANRFNGIGLLITFVLILVPLASVKGFYFL
jgi:hypothetical protein